MGKWKTLEEIDIADTNRTLLLQYTEEDGGRERVYAVLFSVEKENYSMTENRQERWGDNARERSYKEFNDRLEKLGIDKRVES